MEAIQEPLWDIRLQMHLAGDDGQQNPGKK